MKGALTGGWLVELEHKKNMNIKVLFMLCFCQLYDVSGSSHFVLRMHAYTCVMILRRPIYFIDVIVTNDVSPYADG